MKYARSLLNVGFHFRPSDQQLVLRYLAAKICQLPLPSDHVADCDLYGDEPWKIWSRFHGDVDEDDDEEETDLYFFTPLKKMTQTGKRIERTVGTNGATWRSEAKKNPGQSKDGKIKWEKRTYNYCSKSSTEKKRKRKRGEFIDDEVETGPGGGGVVWIMHEYRLEDKEIAVLNLDRTAVNSCVLCRLRRKKNDKSKNKKRGNLILEEEVEEDWVEERAVNEPMMAIVEVNTGNSDESDVENFDRGFFCLPETDKWVGYDGGTEMEMNVAAADSMAVVEVKNNSASDDSGVDDDLACMAEVDSWLLDADKSGDAVMSDATEMEMNVTADADESMAVVEVKSSTSDDSDVVDDDDDDDDAEFIAELEYLLSDTDKSVDAGRSDGTEMEMNVTADVDESMAVVEVKSSTSDDSDVVDDDDDDAEFVAELEYLLSDTDKSVDAGVDAVMSAGTEMEMDVAAADADVVGTGSAVDQESGSGGIGELIVIPEDEQWQFDDGFFGDIGENWGDLVDDRYTLEEILGEIVC
ncbi:NAC domain-containing protein 78 [Linum grandiflorum]